MRYNIFNKAHLPLKTALISSCISITEALNGQVPEKESLKKVEEVLRIFKEQITYESLHILPYIFDYEPSIWNSFAAQHDKGTGISKKLKVLLQTYHKEQKKNEKTRIMQLIGESLNEFMLFNFNHMDDEEAVLNEILWRYYPDRVLVQIVEQMDILPHLLKRHQQGNGLHIATAA